MKKHKVALTLEERQRLETLVRKAKHSALKLMRAHILLKADSNVPGWTDARIADAFGCHEQSAYMEGNCVVVQCLHHYVLFTTFWNTTDPSVKTEI